MKPVCFAIVLFALLLPAQSAQPTDLALSFQLYEQGRYRESIDAAGRALKADPKAAAAYNNIAVSLLGLKRYDEAISNAQIALRLKPDFSLAANNLAWIQGEKAAASGFVRIPRTAAATPDSRLEESYEAYRQGQFQACIAAAEDALRLRPGFADAYNNIGACSAGLGQWDEAIRNEQEAIRLRPGFPLAANNLAYATKMKSAKNQ